MIKKFLKKNFHWKTPKFTDDFIQTLHILLFETLRIFLHISDILMALINRFQKPSSIDTSALHFSKSLQSNYSKKTYKVNTSFLIFLPFLLMSWLLTCLIYYTLYILKIRRKISSLLCSFKSNLI